VEVIKMLNEENKKSLKEVSAKLIRYIMDQIESCRAEEMVNDISFVLSLYLKEIVELSNPTLGELATHMKRSKPSVTIAVDKLESKGYIQRVQADHDKRSFHLHLTEKGKRFSEAQITTEQKLFEMISNSLNEQEIKQLIEINKKLFR
jgi:DNA-binding MarR family transcriptional regulator